MPSRPDPDIPSHRCAWSCCFANDAIVVEVDVVTEMDAVIAVAVEGCIAACCDEQQGGIVEVVVEVGPTFEKTACSRKAILEWRLLRRTRGPWSADASVLDESLAGRFAQVTERADSVGAAAGSRLGVSSSETTDKTAEHCSSYRKGPAEVTALAETQEDWFLSAAAAE